MQTIAKFFAALLLVLVSYALGADCLSDKEPSDDHTMKHNSREVISEPRSA